VSLPGPSSSEYSRLSVAVRRYTLAVKAAVAAFEGEGVSYLFVCNSTVTCKLVLKKALILSM